MRMIKWLKNLFNKSENGISPSEYFDVVKGNKHISTNDSLEEFYNKCEYLMKKYEGTGQIKAYNKVEHLKDCVRKEQELVQLGISTYIYRDDVFEYIEDVAKKVIKVIEMENYTRDIPEDVLENYEKVKDIFDSFFVVYTDYSGNEERKTEAAKREKDPILFGVFHTIKDGMDYLNDKMYVIGDWEDEYCDLTVEKMVEEFKEVNNKDITNQTLDTREVKQMTKMLDLS